MGDLRNSSYSGELVRKKYSLVSGKNEVIEGKMIIQERILNKTTCKLIIKFNFRGTLVKILVTIYNDCECREM